MNRVFRDKPGGLVVDYLGLSIVQHIAQAHGGAVALESDPGKGATFIVRLSLSPAASAPAPAFSSGE